MATRKSLSATSAQGVYDKANQVYSDSNPPQTLELTEFPAASVPTVASGLAQMGTEDGSTFRLKDDSQVTRTTAMRESANNFTGVQSQGGIALLPRSARLAAAASATTTTLSTSGLQIASLAAGTWVIRARGQYRTAATTTGIALAIGGISTWTTRYETTIFGLTASTYTHQTQSAINATTTPTTGVAVANTDYGFLIDGEVIVDAAGALRLNFATEVAGSTATIQPDSTLIAQQIA